MRFYSPRRHRRRLLFPPGLLALAGLLWLGCVYIRQDSRLQPVAAIPFFVYALNPPPCNEAIPGLWESPKHLAGLRVWRQYQLTGHVSSDTSAMRNILRYLSTLRARTASDTIYGAKVIFGTYSKYGDLVKIISELTRRDVKKYAFETRISQPVLYILENKPKPYRGPE